MPQLRCARHPGGALALAALLLGTLVAATPADAAAPATATGARAGEDREARPHVVRDGLGRTRLVGAPAGHRLAAAPRGVRGPGEAARVHLRRYAEAFGLAGTSALRTEQVSATGSGHVVHLQQTVAGLPVLAGQVAVVLDASSALLSVGGETTRWVDSATYAVPASGAARLARRVTGRAHDLRSAALRVTRPARWLFDASLVDPRGTDGARAVWRVEVTAPGDPRVREMVLVDAASGEVVLQVDQVAYATDRVVCDDAEVASDDPVCRPGQYDRVEGSGPTGVPDVDQAYDHTGATSAWFETRLGVDLTSLIGSDRGDGRRLRSTTRYCPAEGCPFDNAFWTGDQMVYGTGFASADDVVAHELSHGVTQHTAGLMYWFQSGAINESMSDVFGELVDLADGLGTDTDVTRWQLGEDLPPRAGGVARDMADPPAFGQPDHTGSDLYDFAPDYDDNGGVHTNSGVANKTAYLVADGTVAEPGGAFNGRSFPGIGTDKAAAVYWATLLMLTPGADFTDLAAALQQACANLAGAGTAGLTSADCETVAAAGAATGLTRWASPTEPREVTMTGAPRSVRLTWKAPASSGSSPLVSYAVHVRPPVGEDDFFAVEPSAREFRLEDLQPGTDYTVGLVAVTADGTSPSVVRVFTGTGLRAVWPASVTYGSTARVRGTLTATAGVPAPGRSVRLLRRRPGSPSYERVAEAVTAADGTFTLSSRPRRGAAYRVASPGSATEVGARGATHVLPVHQRVGLTVDTTLRLGDVARFHGAVAPARPGAPVRLERRGGDGTWRTVLRGRLDGAGRYDLAARPTNRRAATWRVAVPAPPTGGLAAGRSREVVLQLR